MQLGSGLRNVIGVHKPFLNVARRQIKHIQALIQNTRSGPCVWGEVRASQLIAPWLAPQGSHQTLTLLKHKRLHLAILAGHSPSDNVDTVQRLDCAWWCPMIPSSSYLATNWSTCWTILEPRFGYCGSRKKHTTVYSSALQTRSYHRLK